MRAMLRRTPIWLPVAALLFFATTGFPAVLNYSGRLSLDGTNFTGQGDFVFSLHDTNGMILWASGDFPILGRTNLPRAAWRLPVRDGVYNTRLGDTNSGMPALDIARVLAANEPFLRVWFAAGATGWRTAEGESPIKSALNARAAEPPAANAGTVLVGAQADAILRELRELRAIVQKLPAPPAPAAPAPEAPKFVTVPLGDSPSLGNADAPLVLVEFTDYQCPFCKRAHDGVLAELKKKFVETGKLRFVTRNLPLSFHPNAEPAAHAALCALQQNQFWPMRDKLFALSATLSRSNYLNAAAELNLDAERFRACLDGKAFATQIAKDAKDAEAAGITGTPSFVLGKASGGKITGLLMVGAKPYPQFEAEIEKLLAAK